MTDSTTSDNSCYRQWTPGEIWHFFASDPRRGSLSEAELGASRFNDGQIVHTTTTLPQPGDPRLTEPYSEERIAYYADCRTRGGVWHSLGKFAIWSWLRGLGDPKPYFEAYHFDVRSELLRIMAEVGDTSPTRLNAVGDGWSLVLLRGGVLRDWSWPEWVYGNKPLDPLTLDVFYAAVDGPPRWLGGTRG